MLTLPLGATAIAVSAHSKLQEILLAAFWHYIIVRLWHYMIVRCQRETFPNYKMVIQNTGKQKEIAKSSLHTLAGVKAL